MKDVQGDAVDVGSGNVMIHYCAYGYVQRRPDGDYTIRVCRHMDVFDIKRGRIKKIATSVRTSE